MQATGINIMKGDRAIWIVVFIIAVVSIPIVYSAAGIDTVKSANLNTSSVLIKQIIGVVFSMVIIYAAHLLPFRIYFIISKYFIFLAILLLALTLKWGTAINGAKRWLDIFGVLRIQPSELGKLSLIMYSARLLALNYADKIDLKKAILKISVATLIIVGLIIPEDFSTSLLVIGIVLILLYIGRVDFKKVVRLGLIIGVIGALYLFITYIFQLHNRVDTIFGRIINAYTGTQVSIAKAAIVKGGILGEGPGSGVMKYVFSQSQNDFIYAFSIEEYGLIAALAIPVIFLIIFYRGVNIAKNSNKPFAMFLTIGLTLGIVMQAFIHMAVSVNLIPPTGQTLPFLSAGLTSLFINIFALGIILNVSLLSETKNVDI
jgi:cell division protein FtsW